MQHFVKDVREQYALTDTVYTAAPVEPSSAPAAESAADTSFEEEADFTADEAVPGREVET